MIQFEHINNLFAYNFDILEKSKKRQTLRPQREHLKTPIPQAGNYATPSGKPSTCLPLEGLVEQRFV